MPDPLLSGILLGGIILIGLVVSVILCKEKRQKIAVGSAFAALFVCGALFYLVIVLNAQSGAFPFFIAACLIVPIGLYLAIMFGGRKQSPEQELSELEKDLASGKLDKADGFEASESFGAKNNNVELSPEPKPERRLERKPERRPEIKPESKPEAKRSAGAGFEPEPRPEPRFERRPEPRPERRPEPRFEPALAAKPEFEPQFETGIKPEPEYKPAHSMTAAATKVAEKPAVPAAASIAAAASRADGAKQATPSGTSGEITAPFAAVRAARPSAAPAVAQASSAAKSSFAEGASLPATPATPSVLPSVPAAEKSAPASAPAPVISTQHKESKPAPSTEPAAISTSAKAVKDSISDYSALYQKAETFKDKEMFSAAALLYERSVSQTGELAQMHKSLFAAMNCYLKADMKDDVRRLIVVLEDTGTINPAQRMKLAAIQKML